MDEGREQKEMIYHTVDRQPDKIKRKFIHILDFDCINSEADCLYSYS